MCAIYYIINFNNAYFTVICDIKRCTNECDAVFRVDIASFYVSLCDLNFY